MRFDESPSPSEFVVAGLGKSAEYLPVGSRQPLVGENMTSRVFRTGRLARIDDYAATASGPIGEALKAAGIQSIIGAPIMVEGRLWGAMGVASRDGVLPPDSESRLGGFTELMATAIANAESHAREERLAEEQAALRRVATLVAEDVPSSELFDAVAREVGTLLGADFSGLARFEDDAVIPVALWAAAGEHPPAPPTLAKAARRSGVDDSGDGPTGALGRLGPSPGTDRGVRPRRARRAIHGGVPDLRRRTALGRPGNPLETARVAARRHRVAYRAVHGPGRHGGRQRRGACRGGAAGAGAGGSAARGDGGGARGVPG